MHYCPLMLLPPRPLMNRNAFATALALIAPALTMLLPLSSARAQWSQVGYVQNGMPFINSIAGVYDMVISADGQWAYTAAYGSSAVTVFPRNTQTGLLSFPPQVFRDGINGVNGIGATRALELSPDGKFLYAAGESDNAIAIFQRNTATGQLAYLDAYSGGGPLGGLLAVNAMNISGDGKFVYASSEANGTLSTFTRDAATGALSHVETLKSGVPPTNTLDRIRNFTITDDDRFLYAPARDSNAVTQFVRDQATGKLTASQVTGGAPNFTGPTHITFSPDGLHAYVTAQISDSLSLFDVDPLTGSLTYNTTYHDNVDGFNYLNHAEDVVVTEDGRYVAVTATIDGALSIFQRNLLTGELTPYQTFVDGQNGINGLFRAREMTFSPDGQFLYVMSPEDNAIAIFRVPEPDTLWLASAGLGGMLALAVKRTRRRRM